MARATAAEMVKLFGGTYPAGHDATTFVTFITQADSIIDTLALPAVLSTTGTNEIALANRIAVHLVHRSMWLQAGGVLSGVSEPPWVPEELRDMLNHLAASANYDGWAVLDGIPEDG